jgi:peptide/nickel transport system substrate-binding protein
VDGLNTRRAPFDDLRVRRAINYAIDQTLLCERGRYLVSLLRRLGYRADLKVFEQAPYFAKLNRTPNVQAGFGGWFGTHTAADMFVTLTCGFTYNWAHFCDRRFDAQVRRLAAPQGRDPTAAQTLAAQLDRTITNRAPWVPLFTPLIADFASARVASYQANTYASTTVLLDQLWVR